MGVAGVMARTRAGSLAFDRGREGLVAEPPKVRADVPKLYLQWGAGSWRFIVGTYRVGFAQGLTFDTTGIRRVDGFLPDDTLRRAPLPVRACRLGAGELAASPCAGPAAHILTTPDFGWTEGLRGLAVSVRDVAAGAGTLEMHGFLSWQAHSVYQYQLVDRGACAAPGGDGCSAPPVHVRLEDPQAAAPTHAWQTFPRVHDLGVLGARVAYRFGPRTHVGATAYGAGVRWRVPGMALDFQDWARLPYGGPFGAIGVDAAFGRRRLDAHLEVAHSLDSMPGGGGGVGAIARMVATVGAGELDASVRYYHRRFANPFARPLSAADRFGGLRARDEVGTRVAYAGHVPALRLDLRGMADLWHRPSLGVTRWRARLRADHRSGSHWRPGLEVDFTDQDVGEPGRGPCLHEGGAPGAVAGDCGGMRYHLTGRLELAIGSLLRATVRYRHSFVTDRQLVGRFRQDASTWATVRLEAMPTLRLAARMRHLLIDLSDGDRHEHSVRGHLEATWTTPGGHLTRVRYELIAWLDGRESTALRVPSPVHWLWVEVQIRIGKGGDDD
jgi:hypothetical protein